jgi:hypothetical protein
VAVTPGKDDKDMYRRIGRGQFEVPKGIAAARELSFTGDEYWAKLKAKGDGE